MKKLLTILILITLSAHLHAADMPNPIADILNEYGITKATVSVSLEETAQAANKYPSAITGIEALGRGLFAFFNDKSHSSSPLSEAIQYVRTQSTGDTNTIVPDEEVKAKNFLRLALDQPDSEIHLLTIKEFEEGTDTPEGAESIADNWIFVIELGKQFHLSQDLYWLIIDRANVKEPYTYGFN